MFTKLHLFYLSNKINIITIFIFLIISFFFAFNSSEDAVVEPTLNEKQKTNLSSVNDESKEVMVKNPNSDISSNEDVWTELGSGIKIFYINKTTGQLGGGFGDYDIDYETLLSDGKLIGSDSKIIKIDRSIQGWRLAFPLIPEGSRFKLFVPPGVAYGSDGIPGIIPPNEPLIFNITIKKVPHKSESIRRNIPLMLKDVFLGSGDIVHPGQTLQVFVNKSFFPFSSFHVTDVSIQLTIPTNPPKNNWKKILVGKSVGSKLQIIIPTSMDIPELSESTPEHDLPIYLNLYIISTSNTEI
jgi:FKBP-type peptidyl-prolyl cis-trans isomerase